MKNNFIRIIISVLIVSLFISGCSRVDERKPYGNQENSDIIITPENSDEEFMVTLYFADMQKKYLVPEVRTIKKGNNSIEKAIVTELIKGPYLENRQALIPEDIEVLFTSRVDGIVFIDFSIRFKQLFDSTTNNGLLEEDKNLIKLMVHSIVNTLTELDGVNNVRLMSEGETIKGLGTELNIEQKLSRKSELIINPAKVLNKCIKAMESNNWELVYDYIYKSEENKVLNYEQFLQRMREADPLLISYKINGFEILVDGQNAIVYIDYKIRLSNDKVITGENELIRLVKVNDLWKLKYFLPVTID